MTGWWVVEQLVSRAVDIAGRGELLLGPVVPEWFKAGSDGCSVPWWLGPLRLVLVPRLWRARCYVHDFEYYLIPIAYSRGADGVAFENRRHLADVRLRENIGRTLRWRWLARRVDGLYFLGVRGGGGFAIRDEVHRLRRPPDEDALVELHESLKLQGMLTDRARGVLAGWQLELSTKGDVS